MTVKRFTLFDDGETIFDNETVAEDGGKQTYWVVEYGQRVKVVELLNELHEENNELRLQLNQCSDQRNEFHRGARENANCVGELKKENEELKKEVEMLRNGLKAYDEALPLYLNCEDIMHFNNRELFEFKMEQMDFYNKYPNRIHYK